MHFVIIDVFKKGATCFGIEHFLLFSPVHFQSHTTLQLFNVVNVTSFEEYNP